MKILRQITGLLSIAVLFFLTGCGEDRTYEYLEQTEENQWIYSQMRSNYFWADSIEEPQRKSFFSSTSKFFNSLLYSGDKVSYFTDTVPATNYGMSFAVMRDPLEIERSRAYAVVLFVEPLSPADRAGIKRGTWIYKVGNRTLSSSNYGYLESGDATTLYTRYIELNEESMEYEWVESDTVSIAASAELAETAVYMDSIYTVRDRKIGYVVINRFDTERTTPEIERICSRFAASGITDLIIDLRYNSGGSLASAAHVASAFVPAEKAGTPFCKLGYNSANSDRDNEYLFEPSAAGLSAEKIYLLTTARTAGAAEAFVAALKSAAGSENIITVGEPTAGANLYTETIESPYGFKISPAIAHLYSPEGTLLPADGIYPDHTVNELSQFYTVHPLGELQEYLLYCTTYLIVNGTLPYANQYYTNSVRRSFATRCVGIEK